jgi:hypothetical protein
MNRTHLKFLIREMVQETLEESRWSYEAALERYAELLDVHLRSVKPSDYQGPPGGRGLKDYMTKKLSAGYDALNRGMMVTGWTTEEITDETVRRTKIKIRPTK